MTRPSNLVVGVGNVARGDDGAGIVAVRRLARLLPSGARLLAISGDVLALLDEFATTDLVMIVDSTLSGAPPGSIRRVSLIERPLPADHPRASTHGFDVAQVVELARALGRLPRRLILYGIESDACALGDTLSPEVDAAVDEVVRRIVDELSGTRSSAITA
jgi:hydrogenase maturation protease